MTHCEFGKFNLFQRYAIAGVRGRQVTTCRTNAVAPKRLRIIETSTISFREDS